MAWIHLDAAALDQHDVYIFTSQWVPSIPPSPWWPGVTANHGPQNLSVSTNYYLWVPICTISNSNNIHCLMTSPIKVVINNRPKSSNKQIRKSQSSTSFLVNFRPTLCDPANIVRSVAKKCVCVGSRSINMHFTVIMKIWNLPDSPTFLHWLTLIRTIPHSYFLQLANSKSLQIYPHELLPMTKCDEFAVFFQEKVCHIRDNMLISCSNTSGPLSPLHQFTAMSSMSTFLPVYSKNN